MRAKIITGTIAVVVLSVIPSVAARQPSTGVPGNALVNPGAEDGLSPIGWAGEGFTVEAYGASTRVPEVAFAASQNFGRRLFVAGHGAAVMLQDVPASTFVGRSPIVAGGSFLARAGSGDAATFSLSYLGAEGAAVAPPSVATTPTDRDLTTGSLTQSTRGLSINALPPGTTTLRVTVRASGEPAEPSTVALDGLYLTSNYSPVAPGPLQVEPTATPGEPRLTVSRALDWTPTTACPADRRVRFVVRRDRVRDVSRLAVKARGRTWLIQPNATRREVIIKRTSRGFSARVAIITRTGLSERQRIQYRAC